MTKWDQGSAWLATVRPMVARQTGHGTGLATGSSGQGGGFGNFTSDGSGNDNTNTNRVHAGSQKALAGLSGPNGIPSGATISGKENALPPPAGTTAWVTSGASVTAGGKIGVNANEKDDITVRRDRGGIVGRQSSVGPQRRRLDGTSSAGKEREG
jgi:hypothetical protein